MPNQEQPAVGPTEKSKRKRNDVAPVVSLISGGIAGGVEAAATYPFEFAKTRVQLRNEISEIVPKSRNPFSIIGHLYRTEGLRAMYKGCTPLIIGSVAKDGVRFLSFDTCKNLFKDPGTGNMTPTRNMLAGMLAGVMASVFAVTPTERLKTALIDDARKAKRFKSAPHAIKTIYLEDGFVGIYRGFAGTTLKQAGATSVRMGSYNILKDLQTSEPSTLQNFTNGAIAGTVTTLTTQPFDVIKSRSQAATRTTTVEAFRSVIVDEGIKGFWRGTVLRLGRTVLAGGILFTSAEAVGKVIEPFFEKKR